MKNREEGRTTGRTHKTIIPLGLHSCILLMYCIHLLSLTFLHSWCLYPSICPSGSTAGSPLAVGRIWETFKERHPGDILITCHNHINWLLSYAKASSSSTWAPESEEIIELAFTIKEKVMYVTTSCRGTIINCTCTKVHKSPVWVTNL